MVKIKSDCLTTCQVLDLLKEKLEIESDYQLAKSLNWSKSVISTYRNRPQYLGDNHAIEAANLLGLPVGYVLCSVHAERAKDKKIKEYWRDMARANYRANLR